MDPAGRRADPRAGAAAHHQGRAESSSSRAPRWVRQAAVAHPGGPLEAGLAILPAAWPPEVVRMIAMESAAQGRVGLSRLERSDGEALRRLFHRLSPETLYRRFHSPVVYPEQTGPERLLDIDHRDREAVLAVVDGEIVGVARYFRQPGG